jgi:hypothetical protein
MHGRWMCELSGTFAYNHFSQPTSGSMCHYTILWEESQRLFLEPCSTSSILLSLHPVAIFSTFWNDGSVVLCWNYLGSASLPTNWLSRCLELSSLIFYEVNFHGGWSASYIETAMMVSTMALINQIYFSQIIMLYSHSPKKLAAV